MGFLVCLHRQTIYQVGKGMIIGKNNIISIDGGMIIKRLRMRENMEIGVASYGFLGLDWNLPPA